MAYVYRPRGMPSRFMQGAPEIVRENVLDIVGPFKHAVCEYEAIFRAPITDNETGEMYGFNGLDFSTHGCRGCHFFLKPHEARAYRERNRRKRVTWLDLPAPTRKAIVAYLEWNPNE
jgi:hypothetical protein